MKNVYNNPHSDLTSTDLLNLSLLNKEIAGAFLGIFGYIVLLSSAYASKDVILRRSMNSETGAKGTQMTNSQRTSNTTDSVNQSTPRQTPTPAEIAAVSSWISLIASAILGIISFIRLRERELAVQAGSDKNPLYPTVKISAGFAIVILGALIRAIGSQEYAQLPTTIAIR